MADYNKKKHEPIEAMQVVNDSSVELEAIHEEAQDPLQEITREMRKVAQGASAVMLRETVRRVMPKNRADALDIFKQLVRMRDSGDVVVREATEVVSSLES